MKVIQTVRAVDLFLSGPILFLEDLRKTRVKYLCGFYELRFNQRKPTESVKKYISEGPEKVGVRVVHLEDLARVVIYINIVRNDETLLA